MSRQPEKVDIDKVKQEAEISWTAHPMKRKPAVTAAVSAFIVLCAMLVYYIIDSRGFAILAAVVLFASLTKFYFPTTYFFTPEAIYIKTMTQTLKKPWSLFRSYYPDRNGVLLSPFVEPSRLENFRGLYVMFEGNREDVMAYIKDRANKQKTDEAANENQKDEV
jgi:hypothetical protein